jgi:hypothetical protein
MVFPMDVLAVVRCDPFVTNSEHSMRSGEWGGKGRREVRPSAMAEHCRGRFHCQAIAFNMYLCW